MEQFSITNQIGYGSLISDDGRGKTEYEFVSKPEPVTLTIEDISSVRPIAERDIPRHKPGLHPIEMLHPHIHTIITTNQGKKIYLFDNIEDVLNARKMPHGGESSLTPEGRLICAMYDRKKHLVLRPRKVETIRIDRSEISSSNNEWEQSRSPATSRKTKWAAGVFVSLAVSGAAVFGALLPNEKYLPTAQQYSAATAGGVNSDACSDLAKPNIFQTIGRWVILKFDSQDMMTSAEASACVTAVDYTLMANQDRNAPSSTDAKRLANVTNISRALATLNK